MIMPKVVKIICKNILWKSFAGALDNIGILLFYKKCYIC